MEQAIQHDPIALADKDLRRVHSSGLDPMPNRTRNEYHQSYRELRDVVIGK